MIIIFPNQFFFFTSKGSIFFCQLDLEKPQFPQFQKSCFTASHDSMCQAEKRHNQLSFKNILQICSYIFIFAYIHIFFHILYLHSYCINFPADGHKVQGGSSFLP